MVDLSLLRTRDILSSLVCMAIGMFFTLGSIKYGDVRAGIPSAGLFPFIGGLILAALSGLHLVLLMRKRMEKSGETFFPQRDSLRKILLVLVALFAYGMALEYAGFFLMTCLFMVFLLKFIEPVKWSTTFFAAIATAILSYLLFEVWLQVQLPPGILLRLISGFFK